MEEQLLEMESPSQQLFLKQHEVAQQRVGLNIIRESDRSQNVLYQISPEKQVKIEAVTTENPLKNSLPWWWELYTCTNKPWWEKSIFERINYVCRLKRAVRNAEAIFITHSPSMEFNKVSYEQWDHRLFWGLGKIHLNHFKTHTFYLL